MMKEFIDNVVSHLNWEEIVDFCNTIIHERYEILLIALAIVFIMVVCLSTILERLHERGGIALVPIYRFTVIFSKIGLHPALSLLMIIPGVNIIMRIVFYIFLARKFNRSYIWVPFLVLFPIVTLPVVAFGEGHCIRVKVPKRKEESVKEKRPETEPKAKLEKKPEPIEEKIDQDEFEKELEKITEEESSEPKPKVAPVRRPVMKLASRPSQKVAPVRVKPTSVTRPVAKRPVAQPAKKQVVAQRPVTRAKMPTIQRSTRGLDGAMQTRKVTRIKSEYEILLEKQQAAQRRREDSNRHGVVLDMTAPRRNSKKVASTTKRSVGPKKAEPKDITVKFD